MFSRPTAAPEPRTSTARKAPPILPNTTVTQQKISSEAHAEASESASAETEAADGDPEAPVNEEKTEAPETSETTAEGDAAE